MEARDQSASPQLRKDLGLAGALSIVVGMVLGAGVFMKPPAVMAAAGDSTWALAAWVIGALLSMAGGLTLCELGVLFPRTGGVYVFLEEIYGTRVSYLYGWTLVFIFGPATVGALAGYFSSVFCLLFDLPAQYSALVGFAVMAFVLLVNSIGVKQAGYLQMLATVGKLAPVVLLAVFGLWKGNGQVLHVAAHAGPASFSVAIIATLFAYDGWSQVASVAGEMKEPGKILPRAIIGGLAFLSLVYVVVNVALIRVLPPAEMVALGHDASSIAAQRLFGLYGGNMVAAGIMVSIVGGLNGYVMTLSRVAFAMGERDQLPGSAALRKIEDDSKTPVNAALLLVLLSFLFMQILDADRLTDMAMFVIWIFYVLSFVAVLIARRRLPNAPRSYRVPLYPLTPLVATGGALYILYGMAVAQPVNAAASIGLTLFGLPVLALHSRTGPLLGRARVPKKYFILTGSALVAGLLLLSLKVIDTRPVLRVAVEASNPPVAFEDDSGKLAGLDVDVIEAVGRRMGYRVSFRPTGFRHLLASVEKGLADAAVGELTVTEDRKRSVAFSTSYHQSGLALLVPADSPVRTLDDLRGKSVGVKAETTGEAFLARRGALGLRRLEAAPDLAVLYRSGVLDAVVFDRPILEKWLAQGVVAGRLIAVDQLETYAIAYRKGDAPLGKALDGAVEGLIRSGEMERIMKKWLGPAAERLPR